MDCAANFVESPGPCVCARNSKTSGKSFGMAASKLSHSIVPSKGIRCSIFLAMIIVDMRRCHKIVNAFESGNGFALKICMSRVVAEPQTADARVFDEVAELRWSTHFAGVFSSASATPRCLANTDRCSSEVNAASHARGLSVSRELPRCRTIRENGEVSATSIARLISSTASSRRVFPNRRWKARNCFRVPSRNRARWVHAANRV